MEQRQELEIAREKLRVERIFVDRVLNTITNVSANLVSLQFLRLTFSTFTSRSYEFLFQSSRKYKKWFNGCMEDAQFLMPKNLPGPVSSKEPFT